MNWLQLIDRRISVRQYSPNVDEAVLARVREICERNQQGINQKQLDWRLLPGKDVHPLLRGFLGSYGRVLAPWYIAIMNSGDKESLLNMGYRMEKNILEMTNIGLGTCWIGGLYDKKALNDSFGLGDVRALIAWGHPGRQSWNKAIKLGLGKRLPPEKIATFDGDMESAKLYWRPVLEAVRWAPSAVNRQPWRLWFTPGHVHVFSVAKKLTKSYVPTDMGIALCHLDLACSQLGIKGKLTKTQHPTKKGWEYWMTYVVD